MPVPEVLRAISNRATDRQERQRYRSARGMARALEGWMQAEGAAGGGPLALLIDRLHSVGALPSSPGSAARAARLALMDRERTNELAEVVLQDLALAFELLRWVNSAQVRAAAGGRQRAGADDAPRDRDARPGRSASRCAGPADLARARCRKPPRRPCRPCSTIPSAPAGSPRHCARPATTPRWCTW